MIKEGYLLELNTEIGYGETKITAKFLFYEKIKEKGCSGIEYKRERPFLLPYYAPKSSYPLLTKIFEERILCLCKINKDIIEEVYINIGGFEDD